MTDPVTLDGEGPIGEFDEKRAENAVQRHGVGHLVPRS